jgi:hypothetical protein
LAALLALHAGIVWSDASVLELPGGERIAYSMMAPGGPGSALETARRLHAQLAAGDIAEAAALSNTPRRRYEVLREFRERVGAEEMKRLYQAYLDPGNRAVSEVIIGRHRLLVWKLVGLERVAGEFFVEVDGRLLLDDVPSETRSHLRRILQQMRSQ